MQHTLQLKYYQRESISLHSPLFKNALADIEDKRSKLFPDRKQVPGRKIKFIMTIAALINIYFLDRYFMAKQITALKNNQKRLLQRKSVPFFQSLEDIQYTTMKHRMDLIMLEAFKPLGGAAYLQTFVRFHNPQSWVPPQHLRDGYNYVKTGTMRKVLHRTDQRRNKYLPGHSDMNA